PEARGGVASAAGRDAGCGVAVHWRDGGDAGELARPLSCRRRGEPEESASRRARRRDPAAARQDRRDHDGQRAAARALPPDGGREAFLVAEAEAMSEALSPSAGKPYGLARVCRWWEVARSTVYATRDRRQRTSSPGKRGPKTRYCDTELLERIRQALATSLWAGEGHRKARAQLRAEAVRTPKPRVLRLVREANLLAPSRAGAPRGPRAHDGKITTERPDEMWGTDGTTTMTGEGQATIFVVVDHCTSECLGLHGTARGSRFEALEPVRQAVTEVFGGADEN